MQAALVVLDGWGLNDDPEARDAVRAADTPTFDRLRTAGAFGTLETHGRRVGLPAGQMGNSEVGHLNIGAGRVVLQDSTRVSEDAEAGVLGENDAVADAFAYARDRGGRVHLMGLVSDGGVHSYQHHIHALVEAAADAGVEAVTHAFTDGRDTAPKSGAGFLRDLDAVAAEHGTGDVATVTGRYYAMDRDENWDRTARAFDAVVNREAPYEAESAVGAVEASYARGDTDEFVEPTLVAGGPALGPDDAVVFCNFRADRARQLTRMLAGIRPGDWEAEGVAVDPPGAHVVTMTEYDATFDLPVAFPPNRPENTLGEALADAGRTQLRAAESEKYPHVTYFLNGGREVEFAGERRRIVDSPDVATYDLRPAMSAAELTDEVLAAVEADDPDVLVLNYANPDMVGHTGDFDAAVAAVEAVDEQLGRLAEAVAAAGGHLLVTADHGNADDMGTADDPHTAHTTNPVPFLYVAPDGGDGGTRVREGGALCDIAPTLLALVGVAVPGAMTGEDLLE
ncbi:2,3-bisphosphoglycerate-independent phosphoglycerate mutase [Halosegnis marinus]|uniref:2,3-bisphosphoglycerate-independent phosphoglycerate mutase n=1 Tax=Halosegnis marinus TaxID=3034023 RepID=A0ABD5ZLG5_9EURY|nr:2,3-bisphosphoglycerate-independent phosphoglycerate mutase [Halosegnis sp. DT85]